MHDVISDEKKINSEELDGRKRMIIYLECHAIE